MVTLCFLGYPPRNAEPVVILLGEEENDRENESRESCKYDNGRQVRGTMYRNMWIAKKEKGGNGWWRLI